ncbi:MAG: ABC transporter substrate-binding protein [Sulfolobales archaeon]|nr:ABC transporter substrate-binding protein [Sulfolobales archaeon]
MAVTQKTLILGIVLLVVGLGVGYGFGTTAAPVRTVTTTVSAPATTVTVTTTTTVARTVTQTVTTTAPVAGGLSGAVPIGGLWPLTGELSSFGEENKVAFELAVKEVNDWLKARGEAWYLSPVVEDSATDPKTALDKMRILHGRGVRIVVGPMASAEIRELKSYADANKILVISPSSTSPGLAIPGDFVLRYCPDDTVQGPAIARTAYVAGVRYLIPVWRGDAWGDGLKDATVRAFSKILQNEKTQGAVHDGIRFEPGAKEFSVEAAKLADIVGDWVRRYGADKVGVLLVSFEEAIPLFVASGKYDVLSRVKWFGTDGTAANALLVNTRESAAFSVKTKFVSTIAAPSYSPKFEHVKTYIEKTLGRTPAPYAYNTYDAVWTVAIALEAVDEYSTEKVRALLPSVIENYFGASGWFRLNEAGDRAFADYELWAILEKDGKYGWSIVGVWKGGIDAVEWKIPIYG